MKTPSCFPAGHAWHQRFRSNAPPTPPQLPLALRSVPSSIASGRRVWGVGPPLYHGVRAVVRPYRHPKPDDRRRRGAAVRRGKLRNELPTKGQPPNESEEGREQRFHDGS